MFIHFFSPVSCNVKIIGSVLKINGNLALFIMNFIQRIPCLHKIKGFSSLILLMHAMTDLQQIQPLHFSIFQSIQQNGKRRVKIFLQGYQQILPLPEEEINVLDTFVRLKLTLSIIEDLRHCDNINDLFIQSCLHLLHSLHVHYTLGKDSLIFPRL